MRSQKTQRRFFKNGSHWLLYSAYFYVILSLLIRTAVLPSCHSCREGFSFSEVPVRNIYPMMNVTRRPVVLSESSVLLFWTPYKEEMCMVNVLQKYFPMLRTRESILNEISGNDRLMKVWQEWNKEQRELFLKY